MKIKKEVLRRRYYQVIFVSVIIIVPLFFASKSLASRVRQLVDQNITLSEQVNTLKKANDALRDTHYHFWSMDASCSDQLTNSVDGVLRIKVSK